VSTWKDNDVQFPRLLAEIASTIDFNSDQVRDLCDSMDIHKDSLDELFERAKARWDRIKRNTRNGGYMPDIAGEYNDDLHPDEQLDVEERISALIFDTCGGAMEEDGSGVPAEETCNQLGRDILKLVLQRFRPDLFER
jgi:hypothetical protein